MSEGLTVCSLFDGYAAGLEALKRCGISVRQYFASEVDKYAIAIARKNHPEIIHVGDVSEVKGSDLPKIDLLIGGSPCQGFSSAGKGLNFEDPRSALFFEYVRILNELRQINPDILFLLENVPMKKEHEDVITKYLGVHPIKINSALVSAQNRERLYWTNINAKPFTLFGDLKTTINQPVDRKIFLKDIIQWEVPAKHKLSDKAIKRMIIKKYSMPQLQPEKTGTLNTKNNSGQLGFDNGTTLLLCQVKSQTILSTIYKDSRSTRVCGVDGKSASLAATDGGQGAKTGLYLVPVKGEKRTKQLEIRKDFKSNAITSVHTDCLILQKGRGNNQGGIRGKNGKTPCLSSSSWELNNFLLTGDFCVRKLTPVECERLQTLQDNYTEGVSDTQRYKMLGNGWTVDVIAHILGHLPVTKQTVKKY